MDGADNWQGRGGDEEVMRYFVAGSPIICEFIELLQGLSPKLKEVPTVEKCDFILFFSPSFSEAKTAIESALLELHHTEPTKPVLLVVLHYTVDGDISISDSSEYLRESTLTVDCLISNDENLLQCTKNDEALTKAKEWIQSEIEKKKPEIQHNWQGRGGDEEVMRYFVAGSPIICEFIELLQGLSPKLKEVPTVEKCDFILFFSPSFSEAKTAIESALLELHHTESTKPVLLVVLHYTVDGDISISDSSEYLRESTLTVDCLISNDENLLQCTKNDEALTKAKEWIQSEIKKKKPEIQHNWQGRGGDEEVMRYFVAGSPIICEFIELLQGLSPKLKEVPTVEKCDFILFFSPSFSEAKTAIESALLELHHTEPTKPVLLVVLHYTVDGDISISDSSEYLRESTLTVDCLISNDENLLQCTKNDEALTKAKEWIQSEIKKKKPEIQHEHPCASIDRANQTGTEEECDGVLHDIDEAEQILNDLPATRPAASGMLYHTPNPDLTVLQKCAQNDNAPPEESKPTKSMGRNKRPCQSPPVETKPVNIFSCVTGNTLGSHNEFVRILCKRRAELQEVPTVEKCDVILAFCPVVSAAGIDTKNALQQLNDVSGSRPVVLVVLHHTFDPELIVPDSSRSVNREKTLTVDCLFYEDKGLLHCRRNDEALSRVSEWIDTQASEAIKQFGNSMGKMTRMLWRYPKIPNPLSFIQKNMGSSSVTGVSQDLPQVKLCLGKLNFFTCVTGNTLESHKEFVRILCKRRAELQEVPTVEKCDVILAFCPVVSAAGIDIKNALQQLNDVSGSKSAVLVVLHHTFDPEVIVPDSSRSVNREKTLTVDCLFHEDKGLLHCRRNDEALRRVSEWIEVILRGVSQEERRMEWEPTGGGHEEPGSAGRP
ncbi:uncharacterized protein LOC108428904 isoform X4 [Pygocentrus nattereri]|uniref:uncharacterized protein LOC108428904 isoform X4 n=1 Tax=Pygocentrus nattereri TaxID=42514 RepID=UPI0018915BAA|nr:uncharacterized protein LOC108428904 isoform X4 [Pygocentrus nattereri]